MKHEMNIQDLLPDNTELLDTHFRDTHEAMPELDVVWIRGNGEAVEVKDMNEFHVRNALRILITAVATGDRDTIKEHILGMED